MTLVRPTGVRGRHVFWLAQSGIVYPRRSEAIADRAGTLIACTAAAREALQAGERLLVRPAAMPAEVRIPGIFEELYGESFYRATFIETPYMVPASVKPTQHSSLWISATGRLYRTYRHAATDDPSRAIDLSATTGVAVKPFPWLWVGLAVAVVGIVVCIAKGKKRPGKTPPVSITYHP
jgi:hypothetical protein